jgi:hypothetical protein
MNEQSPKYNQATLKVSLNATSSQESGDGHLQLDLLGGGTTDKCGQVARHANHSAQPANRKDKTMSDTCGQYSSISYASAVLQSSLESRLQQRLEQAGSMIYKMTWKQKVTPRQWSYCQRAASALRTKETDSGQLLSAWPTVTTQDNPQVKGEGKAEGTSRGTTLGGAARMITAWPTPTAHNAKENGYPAELTRKTLPLGAIRHLIAAWPTPMSADNRDRGSFDNPSIQRRMEIGKPIELSMLAHSVTSGEKANTYIAETGKSVKYQLNPRFSLWLMGYPIEWAYCGERVTLSSRKSRQK